MPNQIKKVGQRRDPGGLIIIAMMVMVTLYFIYTGLFMFSERIAFVDSAHSVAGYVESYVEKNARNGPGGEWVNQRFPVVSFQNENGEMVGFQVLEEKNYPLGTAVSLLYVPGSSQAPVIDKFEYLWQPCLNRLMIGLVLLIASLKFPVWRKTSLLKHLQIKLRKGYE
jgi:hypothetical protein